MGTSLHHYAPTHACLGHACAQGNAHVPLGLGAWSSELPSSLSVTCSWPYAHACCLVRDAVRLLAYAYLGAIRLGHTGSPSRIPAAKARCHSRSYEHDTRWWQNVRDQTFTVGTMHLHASSKVWFSFSKKKGILRCSSSTFSPFFLYILCHKWISSRHLCIFLHFHDLSNILCWTHLFEQINKIIILLVYFIEKFYYNYCDLYVLLKYNYCFVFSIK